METNESQELEQVPASENKPARDEHGRLLPGHTANPNGRPIITEEEKLKKKAIKELVDQHIQKLAEALPRIEPALVNKASEGDVPAIKEVHDRVMGKAVQPIKGNLNITNDASDEIDKGLL